MRYVSRLRVIAEGADEAMADAIAETAQYILVLIRSMAPVKTGALRDSYRIEVVTPLHVLIGTHLLYSIFMEFGFTHVGGKVVAPRPHVGPAFAMAEQFLRDRMKDGFVALIK